MSAILKEGTKVKYIGETNSEYTKGKTYEIYGYDDELEMYGVKSDSGEIYCVDGEDLKVVG